MLPANMLFQNEDIFGDFDETSSFKNIKGYIKEFFSCYGHSRSFNPKSSVFRYNDTSNEAYVVESGRVRIYNLSPDGKEVTFKIVNPGGVLGLAEAFINSPRVRYAETMCKTKLWVLSKEKLLSHLSSNNELCLKFLWILHKRVLQYQVMFEDLTVLSVRDRIARLLIRFCKEQGRTVGDHTIIDFPITHEEIAQMVGSTRQTVTLILNEMRKEGIISWEQKKIIILRWMNLME